MKGLGLMALVVSWMTVSNVVLAQEGTPVSGKELQEWIDKGYTSAGIAHVYSGNTYLLNSYPGDN